MSVENGGVTYADLQKPGTVLLVGFEPEEESPILFLRLRKGVLAGRTSVHAIAALASRGLAKLDGTLIPTVPGSEAAALIDLDVSLSDSLSGGVILVGERLASVPGALTEALRLADGTGARLAWVPRRAGERGAVDAGALPNLLPGGRPVTDDAARVEVERVWDASIPTAVGRDLTGILAAAGAEENPLGGLLVGGVELADLPDSAAAEAALASSWIRSQPRAAALGGDRPRRRGTAGGRRRREGRPVRHLGRPPSPVRPDPDQHRADG